MERHRRKVMVLLAHEIVVEVTLLPQPAEEATQSKYRVKIIFRCQSQIG